VSPDDLLTAARPACHSKVIFAAGVSVGAVVGLAVGSIVAMRLGDEAASVARGWIDRLTGRNNRVNFELLLQ